MTTKWFMKRSDSEFGPYTWEQLVEYAREGRLAKDDQVKSDEMDDWVIASEQEGLFAVSSGQTPPPVPPQAKTVPPVPPVMASKPDIAGTQTVSGSNAMHSTVQQPPAAKKKSPLKTLALVGGTVVVLVIIAVVFLVGTTPTGPVEVTNIQFSEEVDDDLFAVNPTAVFTDHVERIYASMKVLNVPPDTTLSSRWIYEGQDEVYGEDSIDMMVGDSVVNFIIEPDGYLLPGTHMVEIISSENDEVIASASFTKEWDEVTYGKLNPGMNVYYGQDFAIAYPSDWFYEEMDEFIVISGLEGTLAYETPIYIKFLTVEFPDDDYVDLDRIVDEHRLELATYDGVIVEQLLNTSYSSYIEDYPLSMFTAEYVFEGEPRSEFTGLIKGKDDKILEFMYTAHSDDYDEYYDVAISIFNTIALF